MDNPQISVISGRNLPGEEESGQGQIVKEEPLKKKKKSKDPSGVPLLLYGVKEIPPVGVVFISALQVIFNSLSGTLSAAFLINLAVCGTTDSDFLVTLISTSLFCVGLTTFLQATFGLRLPVVQGSSAVFLVPIIIMMQTTRWRCPETPGGHTGNSTNGSTIAPEDLEPWRSRIAEISGSLAIASLAQVFLGATGLIGFLTQFIGPLTVTPLLALVALSLARIVVLTARAQWGITLLSMFLTVIFNVGLGTVKIPFPTWERKLGCHLTKIPVFRIFANILALGICWLLCFILTVTNAFPNDPTHASYRARTDVKLDGLYQAPWIFFPYPGQWGPLTFSISTVIGMLAAVIASVLESIGDYKLTAFASQVPQPPRHAVNRAVLIEGIGSVLSGAFGACHATTTYSDAMGYIKYTGVASRVVWQVAGVIYLIAGIVGKVGGVLALVPEPVVGGMMVIGSGMVFSSAIAALKDVNLELPRNLMILGISLMIGSSVPAYIEQTPEALEFDNTGVLEVVLTNAPLVGAFVGFIFDNILPGSRKDRGFETTLPEEAETSAPKGAQMSTEETKGVKKEGLEVYDFNFPCCKNVNWPGFLYYVPFLPLYTDGFISQWIQSRRKAKTLSSRL